MGYEVHITRRENWYDDDGPIISLQEWSDLVARDPEMRLDGYAEAHLASGSTLRTEDSGIAVWTAWSKDEVDGKAWFCFINDNVVVKNPDEEMLRKFWLLAQQLHANVQGDEGERYGSDGIAVDVDGLASGSKAKPRWKFW